MKKKSLRTKKSLAKAGGEHKKGRLAAAFFHL
jgi:hypothetical protein